MGLPADGGGSTSATATDPATPTKLPPPPAISTDDIWDLRADPGRIATAAAAWRAIAAKVRAAADDVDKPAKALYDGPWAGDTADTFDVHRRNLTGDIGATQTDLSQIAAALDNMVGSINAAQGHLTEQWAKVVVVPFDYTGVQHLQFEPQDAAQEKIVLDSIKSCMDIRQHLDLDLSQEAAALAKQQGALQTTGALWASLASGGAPDPFIMPAEATGIGVIFDGDEVLVNTGPGNDTVTVTVDKDTGLQVVTVNGVPYYFSPGTDVVIRGGQGDDTITVAPGTNLKLTLVGGDGKDKLSGGDGDDTILGLDGDDTLTGGAGNDRIYTGADNNTVNAGLGNDIVVGGRGNDRLYGEDGDDDIEGGEGNDTVYAGAGNDRVHAGADRDYVDAGRGDDVVDGGAGDDTVYGMDGNDRLDGGQGDDYLEGANGNDVLTGGDGNDALSGGNGDDQLSGDGGEDTLVAGRGADLVDGGAGNDRAFVETGDTTSHVEQNVTVIIKDVPVHFDIQGSDDFKARVQADIDMLNATPAGQHMLTGLATADAKTEGGHLWWHHGPNKLIIQEFPDPGNSQAIPGDHKDTIRYSPEIQGVTMADLKYSEGPPVVFFYHEMAHTYDFLSDTFAPGQVHTGPDIGQNNGEREAVGLPIDGDNDPHTPDQLYDKHPYDLTENGLRDELGIPRRAFY